MGAIKDYNCRYTNSVGIHEEIIKKLDLKFPDAYKNCATMAAIALSTMEEVLKLPEIDYQNGRIFEVLKACKELREQGENVILAISGPFTILNILIDPRHVFKVMKKNPDLRKQIFHKLEKELLTFLEKGITYGANIISYADSTGSLGILGPNLAEIVVEEFTYPFLKKAEKLPNGKAIIHLCPKTTFSLIGTKHACYEPVPVKKDSQYVSACIDAIGSAVFAGQPMDRILAMPLLSQQGVREQVKVIIGGGPISQRFADKIGADGYSANAVEAVKLAKNLLNIA
ncbi:MAG: uroporphyrinogen decarboxylase family protein [Lachnospiraceae bacterium]